MFASGLRERIYATLAAIAALAVLLPVEEEHTTAPGALASLWVTVGGLWAASLFSEAVAHSAVHGRWPHAAAIRPMLRGSLQVIGAAGVPTLLLVLAWLDVMRIGPAVVASVVTLVMAIVGWSSLALRNTDLNRFARTLVILGELAIALAIVVVKTLAH